MDHSQEKSEEATAKRLKEARLAGDVPFSEDLFKTTFLLVCFGALWLFAPVLKHAFQSLMTQGFAHLYQKEPLEALKEGFFPFLKPMASLMTLFFFATLLLYALQRGFFFVFKRGKSPPAPKGVPALFFLIKGLLVVFVTLFFLLWSPLSLNSLITFPLFLLGALFVWAWVDFFYRRLAWRMRMRMTRAEVKEEQKESEGNR